VLCQLHVLCQQHWPRQATSVDQAWARPWHVSEVHTELHSSTSWSGFTTVAHIPGFLKHTSSKCSWLLTSAHELHLEDWQPTVRVLGGHDMYIHTYMLLTTLPYMYALYSAQVALIHSMLQSLPLCVCPMQRPSLLHVPVAQALPPLCPRPWQTLEPPTHSRYGATVVMVSQQEWLCVW
jgi:hypothetical protein